jgi:hypothetical protein
MSEGKFYFVTWLYNAGLHRLELQKNKSICSESDDLEWAKDEIREEICELYGDGESHIELVPIGHSQGSWISIEPEKGLWLNNYGPELYTQGICKSCKLPIGDRTDVRLESGNKPAGGVCYFSNTLQHIEAYSANFIQRLQERTNTILHSLPILYKGEESNYFELLTEPTIYSKIKRGFDVSMDSKATFKCGECGRESYYFEGSKFGDTYISKEELGDASLGIVSNGRLGSKSLILQNKVANHLGRKKLTDRFHTSDITVVDNCELYSPENLPIVESIDWG